MIGPHGLNDPNIEPQVSNNEVGSVKCGVENSNRNSSFLNFRHFELVTSNLESQYPAKETLYDFRFNS